MKFIITRHTSTDWNLEGRIQGWTDNSISEQGKREAVELAERFRSLGINKIICSDLKRSKETATIIGDEIGVPVSIDARIKECCFGEHEGLTREEAYKKFGNKVKELWNDACKAYDFKPYGGESKTEVLERHKKAFKEIFKSHQPDYTVLIIGHGRGLATFLYAIGINKKIMRGEYRVLEHSEGKFDMKKFS